MRARARMLDENRLHLQDGPIDLIVEAHGDATAVRQARAAATSRFGVVLDQLCAELPLLRNHASAVRPPLGSVARRMWKAVLPFAEECFITPMAAVAGSVADEMLATMLSTGGISRAWVNNGGDIALYLGEGQVARVGLVDRPDRPSLFGSARLDHASGVGGIATSGWRGRSFSLGIADAVTVLARTAAEADAAATVIANAVDLPGHKSIHRVAASSLQPDSDLGERLVTRGVGKLSTKEIDEALESGLAVAERLLSAQHIVAAALHLAGTTRVTGDIGSMSRPLPATAVAARERMPTA
jgi:ApbE superfamily uncharacterized protein (UPF0280 family)